MKVSLRFGCTAVLVLSQSLLFAEPVAKTASRKEPPSPEQVLKAAVMAPGLQIDLWAAEPLVSNPVAFSFDNQGRAWVAETNRRKSSYLDIRSFRDWVPDSLALHSVEERVAFLKKMLPEGATEWPKSMRDLNGDGKVDWHDLEVESEIVRLVEDSTGKGVADKARVVSDGFNSIATGVGAGIAAREGEAFYICEPDVWRVKEDGSKQSILQGLAVHIVYSGHDCHGAKFGPDGRLYFSTADCGARIESEGHIIQPPSCGAVFRCWPDGSGVEMYAFGLRNPQSLVFNELGDLFTGDNNADGGDKARWLHLVEGADYGWRFHYQFMTEPKLGVWNSEQLWGMESGDNALSILPPVVNIGHGPAGVAYYPGTGLPKEYAGAFFMADFPGGVRSFKLKSAGASYTAELPEKTLMDNTVEVMTGKLAWKLNVADVAFGPGGGLYLLDCVDWIPDYNKFNKGRIFRVHSLDADAQPVVEETRRLLAEGFRARPVSELKTLLNHADIRVRTEAQWALAAHGKEAVPIFAETARRKGLQRLHAVWGLGQVARTVPEAVTALRALLGEDVDSEVRAQTAKVLGECGTHEDGVQLAKLLKDKAPRVRFLAAQALRRVGTEREVPAVLKALRQNDKQDPFLRHALSVTLASLAKPEALRALSDDHSPAVRAAALLALRRLGDPAVVGFLKDTKPQIRFEAARAIYDQPIPEGLGALAEYKAGEREMTGLLQRMQAAQHRLGGQANIERLLKVGSDLNAPEPARIQALQLLRQWQPADGRDAFLGRWWPLDGERDAAATATLLTTKIPSLLDDKAPGVVDAAVEIAASLNLKETSAKLRELFMDESRPPGSRVVLLNAISRLNPSGLGELLRIAVQNKSKELAAAASKLAAKLPKEEAIEFTLTLLQSKRSADVQGAFQTLAQLKLPQAEAALEEWMDKLLAGKVQPAVQLDLLDAAKKRGTPNLKQRLNAFETSRSAEDSLAQWRECLEGGDPKAGLTVFREKDEVGCYRCHKAAGNGGDVGPAMDKIGTRHDREYLLRSIVYPNADYAPGFETVLLKLADGTVAACMLTKENDEQVELTTLGTTQRQTIAKSKITGRDRLPSPMPEGLAQLLTKRELRDLVAFLASQR